MISQVLVFILFVIFTVPFANAQPGVHTVKTSSEVFRLVQNEKLYTVLDELICAVTYRLSFKSNIKFFYQGNFLTFKTDFFPKYILKKLV